MNRVIRHALLAAMALAAGACNNDFLDVTPQAEYSDALVWQDLGLSEAYLNAEYRTIPTLDGIWQFDTYGDDAYNKFNYGNVNALMDGSWNSQNYGNQWWNSHYDRIQQLNIFLEHIDDVPGDEERRTQLKGEARFLRAFYYHDLAKEYGDVPLVTESWEVGDDYASVGRSPFDQVVAWIASELDQAATELPAQSEQPASERGRATKGAAMATKADILLYAASALHNPSEDQAKWQAAANAAKSVMDMSDYSFYEGDYHAAFMESGWNSEVLFGRVFAQQYGVTNWEVFLATNGFGGWSAFTPTQQLVDAYRMANGKAITDPTSGYDPTDPYVGREPRFYESILYDGADFRDRQMEFWFDDNGNGGKDTNQGIQPWNAPETGYAFRKFFDEDRANIDWTQSGFHDRIWPTFRLEEMYLDYAEAEYRLGQEGAARDALNMVRTRSAAGLPASTASGTALMDEIRRERRIEMVLEGGKRYFDLLRWRMADEYLNDPVGRMSVTLHSDGSRTFENRIVGDQGGAAGRQRTWNDAYYLWPIPYNEMQKTDLTQNPGY